MYYKIIFVESKGRNPGLQSIWEDEKQRRRLNHESSMIEIPSSERMLSIILLVSL